MQLKAQLRPQHHYRLRAVIVHIGGAESGHYVTYRNVSSPLAATAIAAVQSSTAASAAGSTTATGAGGGGGSTGGGGSRGDAGSDDVSAEGGCQTKWMLASDDSVSMVTLTEVLLCRPYMLFYERC